MQYRKIIIKDKQQSKSSTKDSLLDELLVLRNITSKEQKDKFLNPSRDYFISPYAFLDMEKAKNRIFEAIEKNQKILIWGDFDCDGVTSSSILYKALKSINANVEVFIPDRLLHGHGLNSKELIKLISKEKVKLVITVDCGISNISEVNLLKGLGIDVIITDHHTTEGEIPNAFAIINPQIKDAIKTDVSMENITSLSYNSGSAIAYKLAVSLLENIEDDDLKDELLVISACGIVADVVPLIGENRSMVSVALNILNQKKEKSHYGIYTLLSKHCKEEIKSYDIAFILAPRINAVGRLANASLSFEFLTTGDNSKLEIIIEKLENYNKIRQAKCQETYNDIFSYLKNNEKEANNPAVILINKDWHIGIIGIAAAKAVEEFNKPCFLMTVDENNNARCSIRSNELINVYKIIKENEKLFLGFGGHKLAGGFSFDLNKISFEEVKQALLKTIEEDTKEKKVEETLYADIELQANEIETDIIETINKLEPFGEGNKMPLFAMFDVYLKEQKAIGKDLNHLSLVIEKDDKKFKCVKWGENLVEIPNNAKCDIAFYPRLNSFNGETTVQFEVVDMFFEGLKKEKKSFKIFDHRKKTGILNSFLDYLKKDTIDMGIWVKNPEIKEKLVSVKEKFIENLSQHRGLMFFDYPANREEFFEIISKIKPEKIHFMNIKIDENLENYIRKLNGMIKYCNNKLSGKIEILKLAQALSVSENFVQIALEILEDIGSIKILDTNKIQYINSFDYEKFQQNSLYEILNEEFEIILEFKKSLLNCKIEEIEDMMIKN